MHPDDRAWHVSHETIYNAIYAYPRGEFQGGFKSEVQHPRFQ
jgi:hypothetical protein